MFQDSQTFLVQRHVLIFKATRVGGAVYVSWAQARWRWGSGGLNYFCDFHELLRIAFTVGASMGMKVGCKTPSGSREHRVDNAKDHVSCKPPMT